MSSYNVTYQDSTNHNSGCAKPSKATPNCDCSSVKYSKNFNKKNAPKPFIDEYIRRNFQFGHRSLGDGYTHLSLIPSFLIDFNAKQTNGGGLGYELSDKFCISGQEGEWQEYITYQGGMAYQYLYNHLTGEKRDGGSWSTLIPGHLIDGIDGSKITNVAGLLAGCAVPLSNYYSNISGFVDDTKYFLAPVTVSSNSDCEGACKLHTVIDNNKLKALILPCLITDKGPLFDFNPLADEPKPKFNPQNLDGLVNVAIDGTTIRNGEVGEMYGGADCRIGGKLTSYTYTDGETVEGTGRIADPVKLKCAAPDYIDFTDRGVFKSIPIKEGKFHLSERGDTTLYRVDNEPIPGGPSNVINGAYEYKFETPKMEGSKNKNCEYWWLAEVSITGGTAINVINNAQLEIGSSMWFYENAMPFPGSLLEEYRIQETGDEFTDIPYFVLNGSKRSRSNVKALIQTGTVRISEDSFYGDSAGALYRGSGCVLLKPNSKVCSAIAVSGNFSDNTDYEDISVPVFGANRPLESWFNNSRLKIIYKGIVKVKKEEN